MYSRRITALLLLSLTLLGDARSDQVDDALKKIGAYADGMAALAQNKNEVAAINLRKIDPSKLTPPSRIRLLTRIAEADVRAKKFDSALALFQTPGLAADPEASYWQAVALLGNNQASESEKILAEIVKQTDHPHWPEATLTRTSLLLRFGAPEEAIKILTPLITAEREPFSSQARLHAAQIRLTQQQWLDVEELLGGLKAGDTLPAAQVQYIRARLSLGKADWVTALSQLQSLNQPEALATLPPSMRDGAVISLATALRKNGKDEEAVALLQSFIGSNPESPNLLAAFDRLDEIGVFKTSTIDERLSDWANSPEKKLAAIATYFLAIAQMTAVNEDASAATLETIRSNFKDQPIAERALLQLSEIYVQNANKPDAIAILNDLKTISKNQAILSRIAFIEARADYATGEFKLAADKFAKAAATDESATAIATFNSAIAALKTQDVAAFNQRSQQLINLGESGSAASLQLERSLFSARQKSPEAADQLTKFLADHPKHQRRAEAHLALAYLQLNLNFPVSARKQIEEARKAPLGAVLSEEADYIAFWIEVGDHQNAAAIKLGEDFVKRHPGSSRAPEILFKLGGMYFRDGSFTLAQTHFEQLANQYPTSPRAEIALFTAGRAAMRTGTEASIKRAISLFTEVSALGGEFAVSAELQRALVHRTQLDVEKAIPILNNILDTKPTGEFLFSTLITKGESLAILGEKDANSLNQAISVFDTVSRHPEVTTYWRNQALTRKGNSLEAAGRVDEALAAYEKVIGGPRKPLAENEVPEYDWYYKAGFSAIRIYEERKNWKAAISTANTLANSEGPGAQTARERAEQLETKNFIWRD